MKKPLFIDLSSRSKTEPKTVTASTNTTVAKETLSSASQAITSIHDERISSENAIKKIEPMLSSGIIGNNAALGVDIYPYHRAGTPLPDLAGGEAGLALDVLQTSGAPYGLSQSDVFEINKKQLLVYKANSLMLIVKRQDLAFLTENKIAFCMDVLRGSYAKAFDALARRHHFDITDAKITASEAYTRIQRVFNLHPQSTTLSIPIKIESPKLSPFIKITPPASSAGIVVDADAAAMLAFVGKEQNPDGLRFYWFFAQVLAQVNASDDPRLVMPPIADLLACYMKIASGQNIKGIFIPAIAKKDLDKDLVDGQPALLQKQGAGWTTYYTNAGKQEPVSSLLKRIESHLSPRISASRTFAGREDGIKKFLIAQLYTSNVLGLYALLDADVISLCILPAEGVAAGIAGRLKIDTKIEITDPGFWTPLSPKVDITNPGSSYLKIEVAPDRFTAKVIGLNEDMIATKKQINPTYVFTAEDVLSSVRAYGIVTGFDLAGHAVRAAISWLNGHSVPGPLTIATLDRSEGSVKRLLLDDVEILIGPDQPVRKGDVVARMRGKVTIKDIYGLPVSSESPIGIGSGISFENGCYVATKDGTTWMPKTKTRLGVTDAIRFDGDVSRDEWAAAFGSSNGSAECSILITGNFHDVSGVQIKGNLRVLGSISNVGIKVSGDLMTDGGITVGQNKIRVSGRIDSQFIQGYSPDQTRSANEVFGVVEAQHIETGFILGCTCLADSIVVGETSSSMASDRGGAIINSHVFGYREIRCTTLGGKAGAQNTILVAGVSLKCQRRIVRCMNHKNKMEQILQKEEAFVRRGWGKTKTTPDERRILDLKSRTATRYRRHIRNVLVWLKQAELSAKKNTNPTASIRIRGVVQAGAILRIGMAPAVHISIHNQSDFRTSLLSSDGRRIVVKRLA